MHEKTDAELIRLIAKNHNAALEEIYDRYVHLIYSIALKSTSDEMASREIVQLVFTRVWKNANSFKENKGLFVNWMITITRNITIDYLRKERKHSKLVYVDSSVWEEIADEQNLLDKKMQEQWMRQEMKQAYQNLSADQVKLIHLIYWQGYTLNEVSRMNQIPIGTVKSRLHQTLKLLRKYMVAAKGDIAHE